MSTTDDVVVITGSSGLIGYAVAQRLSRTFRTMGFDREGPPHPPPAAECICVDVTSDDSVREAFDRVRQVSHGRLASVVHLAAYYDFSGAPSPKYEQVTVRGTERLLRALGSFDVEQFVFSSTMLVHAPCEPGQRIDENWPLDPRWPYPASKLDTERLIQATRGPIPSVILRIAGVYDDTCHSLPLSHQIQRIYERRLASHVFPGHIAHGQAFVHLEDVVDLIVRAVDQRRSLPPELTLLAGEYETLSYDELQHTFGRLIHGEEWDTREIPKSLAKASAWLQDALPAGEEPFIKPWMIDFADDHYALDITRAQTALGWQPQRTLRATLPKMIAALKADPSAWYRAHRLSLAPALADSRPPESTESLLGAERNQDARLRVSAMPDQHRGHQEGHGGSAGHESTHAPVPAGNHVTMIREMRAPWLWTNATVMMLGLWLMSSPVTLGYTSRAMTWSDVTSGALLILFPALAFDPRRDSFGRWSASFVGLWLQFAPLVFWAPSAVAYLNDTLVGAIVITLTILVPMMPGMAHHMVTMQPGPEVPPGWTYNPSTWHQRAPMILLGFIGWLISRYLAAFQLGYITHVWEPFFGDGTRTVLTSEVSHMWPVSDAGLGAVAYTIETLMAWMGGKTRWRAMPWMVTFFFILVVPLGLTHIVLVILQPVIVDTWCTLCLAAAGVMLLMIPFTIDEVFAMGQFLADRVRAGKSFWRTFWVGDTIEGGSADTRTATYGAPIASMWPAAVWGVSAPWTLVASAGIGFWLMMAPAALGSTGQVAGSDAVAGALGITVAVVAMAEVVRIGRWLNGLIGLWVSAAPWLLAGASVPGRWNDGLAGLLLVVLAVPRGPVRERYGSWDRWVR